MTVKNDFVIIKLFEITKIIKYILILAEVI